MHFGGELVRFLLSFRIGERIIAILTGFFLDLLLGDPTWIYHPVRGIGTLISWLEQRTRAVFPKTNRGEYEGGILLVVLVCVICTGIPALMLHFLGMVWRPGKILLESFWCFQLLAMKSLKAESRKVYDRLLRGTLVEARSAVSMIVGRDTQALSEEGVTKAAVETVAENGSDGVIAPLFYMTLGGAPLMFLYKAINTMDSMLGYKNEKYLYFGRFAAKLDDAANYVPSRLSGWLMVLAAFLTGMDGRQAFRIFLRDRRNHASPNSAQTEAAMAGALEIQLGGNASYFGKLYVKPTIGDATRPAEPEDIRRANRLLYVTGFLGLLLCILGLICYEMV